MAHRLRTGAAVIALAALLSAPASTATAAPPALSFSGSGFEGGGFVNVVAIDPAGDGTVLAGGDTSGLLRSTDWGLSWRPVNVATWTTKQRKVAAILFSRATPGRVYAGIGLVGFGGGLLMSNDNGRTWSIRSTTPQFSGNNNTNHPGLPAVHPRSTGNLLAEDPATGTLYAGTFVDGVKRSTDGGATWTTLGLSGVYLRSIALDPADPNTLLAASYGSGVYRTTDASGTGTFSALPQAPVAVEELRYVGDLVYAAAGTHGLLLSADDGDTWRPMGTDQFVPEAEWYSIDGYQACNGVVLYASGSQVSGAGLVRSTDGGVSWEVLSASPHVHTTVGGPAGSEWWLADYTQYRLGGSSYIGASIAVDPRAPGDGQCLPEQVLMAGRSGVWRSGNGGEDWYPAVGRLGVTLNFGVAADPAAPSRVFIASGDWTFAASDDHGDHMVDPLRAKKGFDVAVESGVVFAAAGHPSSNRLGKLFSNPDPVHGGAWTDEALSKPVGNKRPLGVAVNRIAGNRVLLAAVDGGGIWRKVGPTGLWKKATGTAMANPQSNKLAPFAWAPGSQTVYLYDHLKGVWRSNDAGQTWTLIFREVSKPESTGYLALDPAVPNRLWVSSSTGLYRLDNADVGTVHGGQIVARRMAAVTRPGPVAAEPSGSVLVTTAPTAAGPGRLMRTADAGTTWADVADDYYRDAGGLAFDMDVASDGTVYITTNGNGLLVGRPV